MAKAIMSEILSGKTTLITAADTYMGPAISARFAEAGSRVIADTGCYDDDPGLPAAIIEKAGDIDVLVVNLQPDESPGMASLFSPAHEQDEVHWQQMFNRLVHPTMRFVSAVLPQMIESRAGKIIVVTSAAPLRAISNLSAYSAARGAQNTYVKIVGAEVARHNVQINAVAQNYTIGGVPADFMEDPANARRVQRDVPAQCMSRGDEQAALCLFLASQDSDFFCGQVFPYAGGWVTT